MFLLPLGRAADIIGRKRIYAAGIALFTLMSLCAAASPGAAVFLAVRAIQGIGGAMIFSTGIAMLTAAFPAGQRGSVLGVNTATVYAGLTLGPVLGGFLGGALGWRSIFLVTACLGALAFGLVALGVRGEPPGDVPRRLDLAGSLIYALSLVALMLGFSRLPDVTGWALIVLGSAGFACFIVWELSCASPVLDIPLLSRNRAFAFSNAAALIHYSATFSISFLLSLYLQNVRGMSPGYAGLVMLTQPAFMAVFSPLAGSVSDRIEPRILASSGMAITACGLGALAMAGPLTPIMAIIACLGFMGFGFALFSSPNTNAVMSSVGRNDYGVASGVLATMRVVGQALSMGVVLMLFSILVGRAHISPEVTPAFMKAFRLSSACFAFLCIPGIFASLARGDIRRNTHG
jgi:MFS family permease